MKKSPYSSRIHPAFRRNLFAFEVDTQCTVHRAKFLKTESILQKYINRQSIVKISTLQCITHRGVDLVPLESKTLYNYERFINNHINQEPSWAGFIQKWGKNLPGKKQGGVRLHSRGTCLEWSQILEVTREPGSPTVAVFLPSQCCWHFNNAKLLPWRWQFQH